MITEDEKHLLRRLAELDPDYKDSYAHQILALTEVDDWQDGTHSISFCESADKKIRVEAIAGDEDGAQVEIMLWANDGKICALELFRSDGQDVRRYPGVSDLKDVWDHDGNPRPAGW